MLVPLMINNCNYYRSPDTNLFDGQYVVVLLMYNLEHVGTAAAVTPLTLANVISGMENNGMLNAFLVIHAALGTTATTELRQLTLFQLMSHFNPLFVQLVTQWNSHLFASYGEATHSHIGLIYFLVDFLNKVNTVYSI